MTPWIVPSHWTERQMRDERAIVRYCLLSFLRNLKPNGQPQCWDEATLEQFTHHVAVGKQANGTTTWNMGREYVRDSEPVEPYRRAYIHAVLPEIATALLENKMRCEHESIRIAILRSQSQEHPPDTWYFVKVNIDDMSLVQAGEYERSAKQLIHMFQEQRQPSHTSTLKVLAQPTPQSQPIRDRLQSSYQPRQASGAVYLIQEDGETAIKIGRGTNALARLKNFQTGNSRKLSILREILHHDYIKLEKMLHERYDAYKVHGEWYNLPHAILAALLKEDFS